ncbi:MAG: SDR family oxidoreductase [Acidimicrobiales bacterium]|nr:SDR family oxidoreductase [Acidimicrobiales bacterium]
MPDLDGRTFCITGANTGIGRDTALTLARRGGRVIILGRSRERTTPVLDDIEAGDGDAHFVPCDLADLESVRAAADEVIGLDEPVHVLINNAGVAGQRGQTVQGFELAFGINHLGHFLLTTRLLDLLRHSGPARVVCVSSDSHYAPDDIDFDAVQRPTKSVTGMPEYGVSKLANVCFAQELARREDPEVLTSYALHPGVIASDIWRRVPWPVRPIMTRFMKSTEEGAQTTLRCATDPDLAGESGLFYAEGGHKEPSEAATPELGAELWSRSEAWVG